MFNLCKLKGDYNKAVEYVDKCLKTTSPDQPRWSTCMMQKAETFILTFYKTSDNRYLKDAVKAYESLLEKMPNNTYVLNNIAYILAENNEDLDKAMEYAKRICEMRPDDAGYLDTYALVLYKKGQYADAVRISRSALQQYEVQRIDPPAEAYEHLGQSLEQTGELSQARAAYEQALENGGESLAKPIKERITAAIERIGNRKSTESK
jgi:tetratricopeptide (TPR) repeat protein